MDNLILTFHVVLLFSLAYSLTTNEVTEVTEYVTQVTDYVTTVSTEVPNEIEIKLRKMKSNREIYLNCDVIGNALPNIVNVNWYKNHRLITERDEVFEVTNVKIENKTIVKSQLSTIKSLKLYITPGLYTCEALGYSRTIQIEEEYYYGTPCENDGDCVYHMYCYYRKCECERDYVYIPEERQCLPAANFHDHCQYSKQCRVYDPTMYCFSGICFCQPPFARKISQAKCGLNPTPLPVPRKDIYKAAMVALTCFIITIIGIFVLFMCSRRNRRVVREAHFVNGQTHNIFNVSEGLAAMRDADKPPTYQEVVTQDQAVPINLTKTIKIQGIPPPSYNDTLVNRVLTNTQVVSVPSLSGQRDGSRATGVNAGRATGHVNAGFSEA